MYDPKSVSVVIGGVCIGGYASGSMIKCKRNQDTFKQKIGGHGDVIYSRSVDKTGVITIQLLAASKSNDALSILLNADELAPYGSVLIPILIKDSNGTTLCAGSGRIKGFPEIEYTDEEPTREWSFLVNNLQIYLGGHD